ncbi:hypothetical protein [Streptomyces sp. KL116D]|uniref:hypothetical protein n=1 Tax=Streptomyces sp. KL116D TaxID=3045152 RepID=UPI003556BD4F
MGANMMRQAVLLIKSEAPLVGTGMEYRCAVDAPATCSRPRSDGVVQEVSATTSPQPTTTARVHAPRTRLHKFSPKPNQAPL